MKMMSYRCLISKNKKHSNNNDSDNNNDLYTVIPLDGIPEAEKDFGLGEGRHDVLVEVGHRVIHAASKTISGLK